MPSTSTDPPDEFLSAIQKAVVALDHASHNAELPDDPRDWFPAISNLQIAAHYLCGAADTLAASVNPNTNDPEPYSFSAAWEAMTALAAMSDKLRESLGPTGEALKALQQPIDPGTCDRCGRTYRYVEGLWQLCKCHEYRDD